MNETLITVQGFVGNEPSSRQAGEAAVTTFRVASTPRRFSKEENAWVDRETSWFTVNAWRSLGANALLSLRKGDPVIVTGRLRAQTWTAEDGTSRQTMVIEATGLGHDLTRGTSTYLRATPPAGGRVDDAALVEHNLALEAEGGQVTSDGRILQEPSAA